MRCYYENFENNAAALFAAAIIAPVGLPCLSGCWPQTMRTRADIFNRIGGDMTDVYIFPSPTNLHNVVLVLDCHGLIPGGVHDFSSTTGCSISSRSTTRETSYEDLVIQVKFGRPGPFQEVFVAGPYKPFTDGNKAIFARRLPGVGVINE